MTVPKTPAHLAQFRKEAIAAAYFEAQGISRKDVARKLKSGESKLANLLKYAEQKGYLSKAPTFLRHNVSDADWHDVRTAFLVEKPFAGLLTRIVPSDLYFEAHMIYGDYPDFVHGAAVCVRQLLRRARRVGVMWGRSVHQLVDAIRTFDDRPISGATQIECIPLCGDPTFLMNQRRLEYSASWLAGELERALRHPDQLRNQWPSLTNVPAYISRAAVSGLRRDRVGWSSFLHQIPGYEAILAKESAGRSSPRLADSVDTVIMGAGIVAKTSKPWNPSEPSVTATGDFIEERIQQEKISKDDVAKLVYGDVGGWLLERPGLSVADRRLVEALNNGWTGLKERDLERIARGASEKGGPGAILIAFGSAKAELILEAARRGLVNQLFVDESLQHRLETLVPK